MQVALIFGGKSAEHEVSINSARTIYIQLQKLHHTIFLVGISLEGRWYLQDSIHSTIQENRPLSLQPGIGLFENNKKLPIDVAFATTHGYQGEDGNLQGTCLLCNIPLCGCDTASSAIGMHKDLASSIFSQHGIPTVPSVVFSSYELAHLDEKAFNNTIQKLSNTLFIKPENCGSSVGVKALHAPSYETFCEAVYTAATFSERVLVQKLIEPVVEAECAVLRLPDDSLLVTNPGKVIDPANENTGFLSYDHKYGQVDTAHMQIPSTLDPELERQIRVYARTAFEAIKADGFARIDFFVQDKTIYLNEINTIPGMTELSHYPTLMASVGYDLQQVVEILLNHAIARAQKERARIYTPPKP